MNCRRYDAAVLREVMGWDGWEGIMRTTRQHRIMSFLFSEVTAHSVGTLQNKDDLSFGIGLVNPRKPGKRLCRTLAELLPVADDNDFLVADECRFSIHEVCCVRDVVFVRDSAGGFFAGEVSVHIHVSNMLLTIMSRWELSRRHAGTRSAEWRTAPAIPTIIDSTDIITAATWMRLPGGLVRTLLPSDLA